MWVTWSFSSPFSKASSLTPAWSTLYKTWFKLSFSNESRMAINTEKKLCEINRMVHNLHSSCHVNLYCWSGWKAKANAVLTKLAKCDSLKYVFQLHYRSWVDFRNIFWKYAAKLQPCISQTQIGKYTVKIRESVLDISYAYFLVFERQRGEEEREIDTESMWGGRGGGGVEKKIHVHAKYMACKCINTHAYVHACACICTHTHACAQTKQKKRNSWHYL